MCQQLVQLLDLFINGLVSGFAYKWVVYFITEYDECDGSMQILCCFSFSARFQLSQLKALWVAYYEYLCTPPPDIDWDHWYSEARDTLSIMYREDSCVVFRCLSLILPHVGIVCDNYLCYSVCRSKCVAKSSVIYQSPHWME